MVLRVGALKTASHMFSFSIDRASMSCAGAIWRFKAEAKFCRKERAGGLVEKRRTRTSVVAARIFQEEAIFTASSSLKGCSRSFHPGNSFWTLFAIVPWPANGSANDEDSEVPSGSRANEEGGASFFTSGLGAASCFFGIGAGGGASSRGRGFCGENFLPAGRGWRGGGASVGEGYLSIEVDDTKRVGLFSCSSSSSCFKSLDIERKAAERSDIALQIVEERNTFFCGGCKASRGKLSAHT